MRLSQSVPRQDLAQPTMTKTIPGIKGLIPTKTWRIKSIHRFGYLIENVKNKDEVVRISKEGWDSYDTD